MYIEMLKLEETEIYVVYRFQTNIWEMQPDKDEKLREMLVTKYGVCKFNKISFGFELDKDKTDQCFFKWPYEAHVELAHMKLIRLHRAGLGFPDWTGAMTGG